jgi:hypothetical protein
MGPILGKEEEEEENHIEFIRSQYWLIFSIRTLRLMPGEIILLLTNFYPSLIKQLIQNTCTYLSVSRLKMEVAASLR